MFVADVKCSQATWQTVPNSRTCSAKASVSVSLSIISHINSTYAALYICVVVLWITEWFRSHHRRRWETQRYVSILLALYFYACCNNNKLLRL